MLTHNTAYPITEESARTLSNISGFDLKTVIANTGWCMTYSETEFRRWGILPVSTAIYLGYYVDRDSYQ